MTKATKADGAAGTEAADTEDRTGDAMREALIHLMVTVSAADSDMTDREMAKIGTVVRTLPIFEGYDPAGLTDAARRCGDILQGEDGLMRVLDGVRDTLPQRLHETAYALAVEVAAADLHVEQEELRVLQLVRNHLDLDKLACAAIERGARARHRTA